jgi:ferredoxin
LSPGFVLEPARGVTPCRFRLQCIALEYAHRAAQGSRWVGTLFCPLSRKEPNVTYVVCEPCRDCKYTDCVTVCPMDCFYQDDMMLYIDADECIDCGACVPECPVSAIFHETEVPARWQEFIALNVTRVAELKNNGGSITERQEPKKGSGCAS